MQQTELQQLAKHIIYLPQKIIFTKSKLISGYMAMKSFKRVEIIQRSFGILLMLQLLIQSIFFQLDLVSNPYAHNFNQLSFIVGLILIVNIIFKHFCFDDEEGQSVPSLIIRLLLLFIMPYPFAEGAYLDMEYPIAVDSITFRQTEYSFKLNYILIIFSVFRSCFFAASYLIGSIYMSPRAQRICSMYGARSGPAFTLRSIFKDAPFSFIATIFVISVLLFSFMFRIAEEQIYTLSPLTIYGNMAWMTVITMTSVGYGNYSPKTPIGRLIGALCVSWGVLIVSVLVVVLTNAFSMNRSESQSLNILRKLEKNSELRQVASNFIRESVWRLWSNRKYGLKLKTRMKERKLMQRFRQCRRMRDMGQISEYQIDFFNEMVRQFERAFINLQNLTSNNLRIINYLNEEYLFKKGLAGQGQLMLFKGKNGY